MKVARQLYTIGHCPSSQSNIPTVSVHDEQQATTNHWLALLVQRAMHRDTFLLRGGALFYYLERVFTIHSFPRSVAIVELA